MSCQNDYPKAIAFWKKLTTTQRRVIAVIDGVNVYNGNAGFEEYQRKWIESMLEFTENAVAEDVGKKRVGLLQDLESYLNKTPNASVEDIIIILLEKKTSL